MLSQPSKIPQGGARERCLYYLAGLIFLALAKAKTALRGYSSPKPFPSKDHDRCIADDLRIADGWIETLETYTGCPGFLRDKAVLELGPGPDLGTGVYLLSQGAARYSAFDVNNLAGNAPVRFYQSLIAQMGARGRHVNGDQLLRDVARGDRFRYIHRPDCDLGAALEPDSIDIVFSQAALEHFVDIDAAFRQLSGIAKPGAVLIAGIDLATHSRWIRDKDPLNIYRYSDRVYDLLAFSGAPNRLRPRDYRAALERHGWADISITPTRVLERMAFGVVSGSLAPRFRSAACEMNHLSIAVCATRSHR